MKRLTRTLVFLLMLVSGCATTSEVFYEYDETVDFNAFETFVVCIDDLYPEHTQYPNYDNNRIRELLAQAVESEMIATGHRTNVLDPQLQVGFELILEQKEATFNNCELDDEYHYWTNCKIKTVVYMEETLVVYVSSFERNQIIWQAAVTCNMNRSNRQLPEYTATLVQQLFEKYPKTSAGIIY